MLYVYIKNNNFWLLNSGLNIYIYTYILLGITEPKEKQALITWNEKHIFNYIVDLMCHLFVLLKATM